MIKHQKRPRDPNQLGKLIVDLSVGETIEATAPPDSPAIQFARSGGLKGGVARARKLSQSERSDIAKKAAKARWQKGQPALMKKELT
jgi:hypothetical protein